MGKKPSIWTRPFKTPRWLAKLSWLMDLYDQWLLMNFALKAGFLVLLLAAAGVIGLVSVLSR